jgi:hypothetical protein
VKRTRASDLVIFDYAHRFEEAIARLAHRVRKGKLRYRKDTDDGIELVLSPSTAGELARATAGLQFKPGTIQVVVRRAAPSGRKQIVISSLQVAQVRSHNCRHGRVAVDLIVAPSPDGSTCVMAVDLTFEMPCLIAATFAAARRR